MMTDPQLLGNKRSAPDEEIDQPDKKRGKTSDNQDSEGREEEFYDSSWLYIDCNYCKTHMPQVLRGGLHGEKLVLHMHAQYGVFSKSSRGNSSNKEDVRIFKDEFLQKVCSLRNEKGGALIIHVTGKSDEKGPSLDDFDQKVGEDLSRMVEDDTMYVENYDRSWYSVIKEDQKQVYLDYLIVHVKGSSSVSTKDFNTLVTWDGSKERPKAREISRLLWRTKLQPCYQKNRSEGIQFKEGNRINLYESRDVQLKRLFDKDLEKDLQDHPVLVGKSLAYRIAFRLKDKLHLLEYITSFSKLRAGGSFYCGIEEEKLKIQTLPEKTKSSKKKKKKKGKKEEGDEDTAEVGHDAQSIPDDKLDQKLSLESQTDAKDENCLKNRDLSQNLQSVLQKADLLIFEEGSGQTNAQKTQPENQNMTNKGLTEGKDYKTAHNMVKGFKLSKEDREDLKREIMSSLKEDILWLRTDGTRLSAEDIENEVDVLFYCTSAENDTFVIEVCVKRVFPGVVFYKSYGPDAFRLTGLCEKRPRVVRMCPSEWIQLLRKAMQCDNCDRPIWKLQANEDFIVSS